MATAGSDPHGKPPDTNDAAGTKVATDAGTDAATDAAGAGRTRRAGPLTVARAVFGSFLGIRKARDLETDASSITPVQAIIGGLIGAAILVASLLGLVIFITRG
jgi:hypothetical protein